MSDSSTNWMIHADACAYESGLIHAAIRRNEKHMDEHPKDLQARVRLGCLEVELCPACAEAYAIEKASEESL